MNRLPELSVGLPPFYLAASGFAALALVLWTAELFGGFAPEGYLRGLAWHRHEMLFGFAPAVIAGFLLTAVGHWSASATATVGRLAALFSSAISRF